MKKMSHAVKNNYSPLRFHSVHGVNSSLSNDRTVAYSSGDFSQGIVFSDRPISLLELVYVKFLKMSTELSSCRIGFTMNDPQCIKSKLPEISYQYLNLGSIPGIWVKIVQNELLKQDSILYFFVDINGYVYYGVDQQKCGILFSGVNTSGKLWVVLDMLGVNIEVKFIDTEENKKCSEMGCSNLGKQSSPQKIDTMAKISQDLKTLFISGERSDVTLKVKEMEFRAHRNILGARSSTFNAMFKHEMQENISDVVVINDCEADVFQIFLLYLYSGDVLGISVDNVVFIHKIADMYNVVDLTSYCFYFMMNNLSIETFCNFYTLAIDHSESELLKFCETFFNDNFRDIVTTLEWQIFAGENPQISQIRQQKAFENIEFFKKS